MSGKILQGDALEVLKTFESESVNCIITSPPYFGLRDYGMEGQIGLEDNPHEFVEKLVDVFREAQRVLKNDGTLWINLGDSYAGSGKGQTREGSKDKKRGKIDGMKLKNSSKGFDGIKPKNLIGIPWRVAFALQDDGWCLRSDIIWAKKNCMPESVTDRPTRSHEYVFLLSKNQNYYYDADAIKEPSSEISLKRSGYRWKSDRVSVKSMTHGKVGVDVAQMGKRFVPEMRNKRSVWNIATHPYTEAHFATFPEKLIEPMVMAACPKGGVVLDMFFGAGTTGVVAQKLGRDYIGIELNPAYIKIATKRLEETPVPIL